MISDHPARAQRQAPSPRSAKPGSTTAKIKAPDKNAKFTTFEIATYEGGYKTVSVLGRISMETGMKVLALIKREART